VDRARLAAIVEFSDDAILSKDLDGTILSWNKAAERLFGYREREIVGKSITLLIPEDRLKEEGSILSRLRRGQRIDHYETIRLRKDGSAVEVSITVSPIRDSTSRIVGASKIVRDLTEPRRVAAALRESEQRMRAIIETAVDAIIMIDERGTIESANPATERLFGYMQSELAGNNIKMLMPEPYHNEHDGYLRNYLRTGRAKVIGIGREVTALRKDLSTFPMDLSVSEVPLGGRRLFTGIIHDLSSRRQLERQIIEASAYEQRRIGQDLHDGLCQDLIGIAFTIDVAARQLRAGSLPEPAKIEQIAASIREAALQARRLSHGLNPVDPKAGGLPPALESLARRISETFQLACTFEWDHRTSVRDDSTATHLYRIAQEAVSNAIKHGKAKEVGIRLMTVKGDLVLTISDSGVGLPETNLQRLSVADGASFAGASPGIGLHSMQYRAHMIGAIFDIRRRIEGGTVVECSVRLPSPPVDSEANSKPTAKDQILRRSSVKARASKRVRSQ
jgi:PAS domain S-box-containing protein